MINFSNFPSNFEEVHNIVNLSKSFLGFSAIIFHFNQENRFIWERFFQFNNIELNWKSCKIVSPTRFFHQKFKYLNIIIIQNFHVFKSVRGVVKLFLVWEFIYIMTSWYFHHQRTELDLSFSCNLVNDYRK
ncbi:hypothetical protein LCGC14_2887840 [marine sediment metagenome]|uniref:Uncharacterized protein n=1 Tax=marine sediment metagenome TaxID=412755 RepID=A0A0F8XFQ3_9ZZZZ